MMARHGEHGWGHAPGEELRATPSDSLYLFFIVRNMNFGGTIPSNSFSIPLLECTQDIKKPRAESLSKIYSINHHLESHSSKTYISLYSPQHFFISVHSLESISPSYLYP